MPSMTVTEPVAMRSAVLKQPPVAFDIVPGVQLVVDNDGTGRQRRVEQYNNAIVIDGELLVLWRPAPDELRGLEHLHSPTMIERPIPFHGRYGGKPPKPKPEPPITVDGKPSMSVAEWKALPWWRRWFGWV